MTSFAEAPSLPEAVGQFCDLLAATTTTTTTTTTTNSTSSDEKSRMLQELLEDLPAPW